VTFVALNRLGESEIAAMIDGVIGNKLLAANIRQDIVERTDGIPLFVEEMTKAVLEAESEGEARRTAAAVPSPALAVPASQCQSNIKVQQRAKLGSFFRRPKAPITAGALASERRRV
jgi:hypothetical protein